MKTNNDHHWRRGRHLRFQLIWHNAPPPPAAKDITSLAHHYDVSNVQKKYYANIQVIVRLMFDPTLIQQWEYTCPRTAGCRDRVRQEMGRWKPIIPGVLTGAAARRNYSWCDRPMMWGTMESDDILSNNFRLVKMWNPTLTTPYIHHIPGRSRWFTRLGCGSRGNRARNPVVVVVITQCSKLFKCQESTVFNMIPYTINIIQILGKSFEKR